MADKDREEFMHDWYAILGCDSSTAKEGIEKAARRLAMKYHPDKTTDPEAPEKFLLVQKAKEILLDDTKRKVIDEKLEAVAKRAAYEAHKNQSMDARRKRMRDEFNDRLNKATNQKYVPTEAEVFQNELKKRSKIIEDLRKKNSHLMEQTLHETVNKESQQTKDFMNYRKNMVDSGSNAHCQLKVKWKRTAESHSDDSLYQVFKRFGSIEDTVLVGTKGTSGLITFTDASSAKKACEFYRDSDEYRVSILGDNSNEGEKNSNSSSQPSMYSAPQSELSSDIRRAMEKNNLLNIIEKLKRPSAENVTTSNTGSSSSSSATANASTTNLNSNSSRTAAATSKPTITAANIASKEIEILQRMREAAARKKQASLATAVGAETVNTAAVM